jgi:hypothetical protein
MTCVILRFLSAVMPGAIVSVSFMLYTLGRRLADSYILKMQKNREMGSERLEQLMGMT